MARGSESKQIVINKIMEMFPGAFIYGKELRIPLQENGERIEIKVALTCAKTNVGGDGATVTSEGQSNMAVDAASAAPTDEEKANIANLMERLGL
ncbi:MAG: hypothetical protein IJY81_07340 [Lachnospiraceae bacterium]|nr:hypothetical protein [Lachnospiraceae bacterium]